MKIENKTIGYNNSALPLRMYVVNSWEEVRMTERRLGRGISGAGRGQGKKKRRQ